VNPVAPAPYGPPSRRVFRRDRFHFSTPGYPPAVGGPTFGAVGISREGPGSPVQADPLPPVDLWQDSHAQLPPGNPLDALTLPFQSGNLRSPEQARSRTPSVLALPPVSQGLSLSLRPAQTLLSAVPDTWPPLPPRAVLTRVPRVEPTSGRFPWSVPSIVIVALVTAIGVGAVAVADVASRHGSSYNEASPFFWGGLFLIFAPSAYRALAPRTSPQERVAVVLLLGVALYAVKILSSPGAFTFSDEYVHLRNTQDILRTHHLFSYNPLLPTAAYYPGLAALTAGLIDLTGLSPFLAGVLIIGVARLLLTASLFMIAKRVTRSDRAAAGAVLVYAANPMFLFWSSTFTYENLALPLAFFLIWWVGQTRNGSTRLGWICAIVCLGAVVVTHHVVAFALTAVLGAWWLAECVLRRPARQRRTIGLLTLLTGGATLVWFFVVARPASAYILTQNLVPAVRQTSSLIVGHTHARKLYSSGGVVAPKWQTAAGFAAVGIILVLLPFAAIRALKSWRHATLMVAVAIALIFPFALIPRLAPEGVAVSGRSFEYVFAGVGCVLGLLIAEVGWRRTGRHVRRTGRTVFIRRNRPAIARYRTLLAAGLVTVVFVGDVTIGTAFYQQLPEATHPTGYPWTVQPAVIDASQWARQHLGIDQRFGSNAIDAQALATYGEQNPINNNSIWPIFFAPDINATVVHDIQATRVKYLLLNWQMTRGVPATPGYYFSSFEPGAAEYKTKFPAIGLQKFSSTRCATLVYKSGPVEIVDVSRIETGSCVPQSAASLSPRKGST
jgi:hypothetical protein